ncbi:MAG: hypothetical protein NG712_05340, partial [Omnitrophica bacterium]|nr:hypothetical protein [Candidatus Omnitrophota bacterium]
GKFCLIQDRVQAPASEAIKENIQEEAIAVLLQLQYKKNEAKAMIEKAIKANPQVQTTEEILNQVYRQKEKEPKDA